MTNRVVHLKKGVLNVECRDSLELLHPPQVQQIDRVVEVVEETLKGGLGNCSPSRH